MGRRGNERGGKWEKWEVRERKGEEEKTKAVYFTPSPFLLPKIPINQNNTCLFCYWNMVQENWNPVFF